MPSNLSIAVLPFQNMSSDAENEYFCDGITEEIINALAVIKSLKVTSRTSSFYFKNKNVPLARIAERLGVSLILEGSVRLSGNTLRITAQLIQAKADFHFWSETWDRTRDNIFEIQDEISLSIAEKIRENFGHFEIQDQLVAKQTESIDAYELSLKGKFHANKWNPDDMRIAISLYEQALELDPKHTKSLVNLADTYSFMAMTGFMSFEVAWKKSSNLIEEALQINECLPGAHYQKANSSFFTLCDFKESLNQAKRAIALKPNYVEAEQFLSFLNILSGEKEKASAHLQLALEIDPLSQETLFFSAYLDYMLEDYESSMIQLNKCLEVNSKNIPAHSVKAICLIQMGQFDEAITYFDKIPEEVVILGEKTGVIGLAYALKNDIPAAKQQLNLLLDQANGLNGFTADSYLFLMYIALGDIEKAFHWIDKALENKSSLLMLRFADPLAKALKADSRYLDYQKIIFPKGIDQNTKKKKALLDKKGLVDYSIRLSDYIREKEPFLDPGLNLRSLATQIDIHPNQLSWLLNDSLGKSFNEYINYYRVQAFKRISKDPKNAHLTIIGMAFDSGFNSKTVFNTYFKKETGLTPKQFLKAD